MGEPPTTPKFSKQIARMGKGRDMKYFYTNNGASGLALCGIILPLHKRPWGPLILLFLLLFFLLLLTFELPIPM